MTYVPDASRPDILVPFTVDGIPLRAIGWSRFDWIPLHQAFAVLEALGITVVTDPDVVARLLDHHNQISADLDNNLLVTGERIRSDGYLCKALTRKKNHGKRGLTGWPNGYGVTPGTLVICHG